VLGCDIGKVAGKGCFIFRDVFVEPIIFFVSCGRFGALITNLFLSFGMEMVKSYKLPCVGAAYICLVVNLLLRGNPVREAS
jgi:hypothetical protein